jgi:hypothetical protein
MRRPKLIGCAGITPRRESRRIGCSRKHANNKDGAINYTYDAVGNRKTLNATLPPAGGISYTYDADDRLGSDQYDNNGNTILSGGTSDVYDFENHLIQKGGVTIVYPSWRLGQHDQRNGNCHFQCLQ